MSGYFLNPATQVKVEACTHSGNTASDALAQAVIEMSEKLSRLQRDVEYLKTSDFRQHIKNDYQSARSSELYSADSQLRQSIDR